MVLEENEKKIGTVHKILVEGLSKNNDKMYTGRTIDNKIVVFEAEEKDIGTVKDIEIILSTPIISAAKTIFNHFNEKYDIITSR